MFRQVIRRTFCVNNNDPFHSRNAKNDHFRKLFEKFQERNPDEIKGNFQQKFNDPTYIEKNEIETRILKVIHETEFIGRLEKFSFDQDMRKQLKLDSLNITVLLTSIEHEFTTVFEDRVFESVRNLEEIVTLLCRDPKIF